MSVRGLLAEATEAIATMGAGNPRLEAELLLARVLDRPRVYLMTHPEHEPAPQARARFEAWVDRRRLGEPLQYILGDAAFRDLTLAVRPGVLIPRAETEGLVDHAWAALRRRRAHRPQGRPWVIDAGVGSGAILLGLIHEALSVDRELWFRPLGIDIASVPLVVTAENAADNRLPVPGLIIGDFLQAIDPAADVALIASNPPYVTTAEMAELPAEIREHEPHEALHAGADGLGAIRRLLDQARPFIERGAALCFEIGGRQGPAVQIELERRGLARTARIHPDLAGRPRVVLIEDRRA